MNRTKSRTAVIQNPDHVISDGALQRRSKMCNHEGKLYTEIVQPDRDIILQRNQNLRNNPGVLQDLSFGRLAMTIPEEDYYDLKAKYPALSHPDPKERTKAWKRFMNTSEAKPFLVQG